MSICFWFVQNQINQQNLTTQKPWISLIFTETKKPKSAAEKKEIHQKEFSPWVHIQYTHQQLLYNSPEDHKSMSNQLIRPKRAHSKRDEMKVESFTHFMRRMFPGEYCTYSFLISNPHCTHLYSISCLLFIPKTKDQKKKKSWNYKIRDHPILEIGGEANQNAKETIFLDPNNWFQKSLERERERGKKVWLDYEGRSITEVRVDNVWKKTRIGPSVGLQLFAFELSSFCREQII